MVPDPTQGSEPAKRQHETKLQIRNANFVTPLVGIFPNFNFVLWSTENA